MCCFAALYFIEEPLRAIGEMVRVLAPGGRIALLSRVAPGPLPAGGSTPWSGGLPGRGSLVLTS